MCSKYEKVSFFFARRVLNLKEIIGEITTFQDMPGGGARNKIF